MSENDEHPKDLAERVENLNSIDQFPPEARVIVERDIRIVSELTASAEQLKDELEARISQIAQAGRQLLQILDAQPRDGRSTIEIGSNLRTLFQSLRRIFRPNVEETQGVDPSSFEKNRGWCLWQIIECFRTFGRPLDTSANTFNLITFTQIAGELLKSGDEQASSLSATLRNMIDQQAKIAIENVIVHSSNEMKNRKDRAFATLNSEKGGDEDQITHGLGLKKAIWTPNELNQKYSECNSALIAYKKLVTDLLATINSYQGLRAVQEITHGLEPIAEQIYDRLREESLKLANRKSYVFHGTTDPGARRSILSTGKILSRKRQGELYGTTHFAMQEAAIKASLSETLVKSDDAEEEQVCFSLDRPIGAYASSGGSGQKVSQDVFAIAVPSATIFRMFGFFSLDGIHCFSLPDPQQGFELSLTEANAKLVCDEVARQQLLHGGGETLLEQYSDVMFNSADALPEETPSQKLENARIVPTGILMDTPGSKRTGMVYRLV